MSSSCEYCGHSNGFLFDDYLHEWKCKYCHGTWTHDDPHATPHNRWGDGLFVEVPDIDNIPESKEKGSGKNLADLLDEYYRVGLKTSK